MSILLKRISLNILPVLSSLHLPCLGESSNKFQAPWFKLGTNISPPKACLKMMFLFPRWDMFSSLEGIYIYTIWCIFLGVPVSESLWPPPWSLGTFHVKKRSNQINIWPQGMRTKPPARWLQERKTAWLTASFVVKLWLWLLRMCDLPWHKSCLAQM